MTGGRSGRESAASSFGVEIDGGTVARLIERGAPLPARGRRLFTTVSDRQAAVEIHVLREDGGETDAARAGGRAARGPKMKSIGRFLLAGIRSARQGEPRVEVSLELDADGILHAAARDLDTGAVEEVAFSQGLPFEEGTPAAEQTEELRLRVLSLARRARAQAGSVPGQEGLRAEIEDMVARSMAALSSGNRDELLGCRTALETLLGELRALAVAPGESPGPGSAARAAGNAEGVPRHG